MNSIVIVGACCSFGQKLIEGLAKKYELLILTETKERMKDLYEIINFMDEIHVEAHELDVENVDNICELVVQLERKGYKISGLVYCSGINILANALEICEVQWDMVLDVNLKGFFFCAKEIIAHMIRKNLQGRIVAIASQHSVVVSKNRSLYCASKAGLVQLAKELALEFSEFGILVNIVSPTFIISERNENLLNTARARKEYLNKIPLNRYATPEDVVNAIIFLLSENSSFITGHNLLVDGGYTIV